MQNKKKLVFPILAAVLVLAGVLLFFVPVRQPAFFEGAQAVNLRMVQSKAEFNQLGFASAVLELEAGDPALEELSAIFNDYRYYRTLKQLDARDGSVSFNGSFLTIYGLGVTENQYQSIDSHGKYLYYNDTILRVGRNNSDWDELQQRLKDFILEYSEEQNTN